MSMYLLSEVSDLNDNIVDSNSSTALHLAVWCNKDNYTQLHKACGGLYGILLGYTGNGTEVLRLVYVKGHKINVQDNKGNTPLHCGCFNGHREIAETLMLAGVDETVTNDEGKTPAQVAESERHSKLLKLLDRDSLWQVMLKQQKYGDASLWQEMLGRQKMSKLSLVVLMMLTVRLMRQRQITGR